MFGTKRRMSKVVKLGIGLLTAGIVMSVAVYYALFYLVSDSFCVRAVALDSTIAAREDIYYVIHDFAEAVTSSMIAELPDRIRTPAEALMRAVDALLRGAPLAVDFVLDRIDPLLDATVSACENG